MKILGATDYAKVNKEILHPDDLERVTRWLHDCIESGDEKLSPNEYRLVRKDKKVIYVNTVGIIERTGDNHTKVFATIQDIADQKKNEEELKKNKNKYARLVNNSPNMIMETDVDTHKIISCNPAMADNLGSSVSEIVGKKIDDFLPPHILKRRIEVTRFALETGKVQTLEDERNGKYFYTSYISIIDDERRSIQTITLDITKQKKS